MENDALTYRDYALFARQSPEEIAQNCTVSVFRGSGPGGQCVNTTDSAVRMRHTPTGITVVSRDSRSQHRNRQACLEKLHLAFARRAVPPKARTKTKVPRRAKEKRLNDKRKVAQKKASRNTFE
ncbi:MAG: peptide chain release factor-like protein [Raoultibacter sp.]